MDQLDWEGKQGWSQAEDQPWSVRGKQVGLVTNYDTLTFVKVFEAVSAYAVSVLWDTGVACTITLSMRHLGLQLFQCAAACDIGRSQAHCE